MGDADSGKTIQCKELCMYILTWSDIENCEGWLSPGGHSSGGRALTAKVRGPWFNPGWPPVFHGSLKIFPSLSSCTFCTLLYCHVFLEVSQET